MFLNLTNIEAGYNAVKVLKGVSINVREGSIVALLGSNGAGKTTTLKVISGLLRVSSGKIEFGGEILNRCSPEGIVKHGIIHVPEGRKVFPNLTITENLRMGAFVRKDTSAIKEDLEKVWTMFPILRERAKQLAGSLSGGEQQMLAIARGLMARPRLMLLDEPSLGLAPKLVSEIFQIIKTINTNDKTSIMIVEQNARMALEIADFGYLLQVGKVVLSDSAQKLKENDAVVRSYLGRIKCKEAGGAGT
ncbi:MAG TPA: ABC transporter ATP-binding protein [Nitrospirae bacterium]|nr:ABC transporter ATP-binding protein [Nitrospirota bacterium]